MTMYLKIITEVRRYPIIFGENMMKRLIFVIICVLPLVLFLFKPSPAKPIILIIGDSLSYPYGIKSAESWTKLLQNKLDKNHFNYQIVNFSKPGDETGKASERFLWALKEYKPNIIIIELGANDGLKQLPIGEIQENLDQMIEEAKKINSKVLLLGIRLPLHYNSEYREEFAKIYPKLAKEEDIQLVPLFLKNIDTNPELMQEDKLHPIAKAQHIILETVWEKLMPLLNKPLK